MHSDFIQSCGVTIWKIKSKPEVSTERLLVRHPKKKLKKICASIQKNNARSFCFYLGNDYRN